MLSGRDPLRERKNQFFGIEIIEIGLYFDFSGIFSLFKNDRLEYVKFMVILGGTERRYSSYRV
jgi:hypothetical protein